MSLFQNIQNMLLRDFLTIYRIMPAFIRRKILLVFLLMLVIAIFEALSILSLSFFGAERRLSRQDDEPASGQVCL